MKPRLTCEAFAYRAGLVRADLQATEGQAVMRFRRARALTREPEQPEKRERHRLTSEEFRHTGATI